MGKFLNNLNEIKDSLSRKKKNKQLIKEYPFLRPFNFYTHNVPSAYDYTYTKLDSLPYGWKIAFGEQLCSELKEKLVKADYLDKYVILDISGRYGRLNWEDGGVPDSISIDVNNIIDKYEQLSEETCVKCGDKATKISIGWASPYCDKCAEKYNHLKFKDINKEFR